MKDKNPYANKYFNSHEKSKIWRTLNKNEDIQRIFNGCKNLIEYMSTQHKPHKLQREDIEHMEIELGKVEIALDRISEFPKMFTFSEEDKMNFHEQYKQLSEKVSKIDLQRISWD